MHDVEVDPKQLEAFTKNSNQGEFVMLNLLKFKEGADAKKNYARYLAESGPFAQKVGASVDYLGIPQEMLTAKEDWDLLLLVRYPSRQAFLDLISNPEYLKAHKWREKAVERAVLYPTTPTAPPEFIKSLI